MRFIVLSVLLLTAMSAVAQQDPIAQPQVKGKKAGPWSGSGKTGAVATGGLPSCEAGIEILK